MYLNFELKYFVFGLWCSSLVVLQVFTLNTSNDVDVTIFVLTRYPVVLLYVDFNSLCKYICTFFIINWNHWSETVPQAGGKRKRRLTYLVTQSLLVLFFSSFSVDLLAFMVLRDFIDINFKWFVLVNDSFCSFCPLVQILTSRMIFSCCGILFTLFSIEVYIWYWFVL